MNFDPDRFLPASWLARITETRVHHPERVVEAAQSRVRRDELTLDGRLHLLAVDHPARGVVGVPGSPLAMADRGEFLTRILRALSAPSVDGIMSTMDVLEDLLLIDDFLVESGKPSLLAERLLLPSLNRGGLLGSVWELDDPVTGPRAETCAALGMDGAKLLLRVDLDHRDSLRTLEACAAAIDDLVRQRLSVFLEPLPVQRRDDRWVVSRSPEALARLVSVAQALGESSRYTWLKLPTCRPFELVARATTMPILLLGGDPGPSISPLLEDLELGLASAHNVRGTLVGRNILYPGSEDPRVAAEAVGRLVHEGETSEDAWARAKKEESKGLDLFRSRPSRSP